VLFRSDPVCGMPVAAGETCCSPACEERYRQNPERYRGRDSVRGTYHLSLNDVKTGRPVLRVPIEFRGEGEGGDAGGHQH